MYIAYDKKNGVEYAKLCTSRRSGKKTSKDYVNLGRVLDKEAGIFKNRERGVFSYNVKDNTYGSPPESFVIPGQPEREQLILDFGDVFFLDIFIKECGLESIIKAINCSNYDTLYSMFYYYIICSRSDCHANSWWEGSYVRILFPEANLSSQGISGLLEEIGEENAQRSFFDEYFSEYRDTKSGVNILIDSTGLPNSVHFPLSAVSNHNGEISNEVRLIYVSEQKTGLPVYYRYCPGNVVDVSILIRTMNELRANGVKINLVILDTDYYSDNNIKMLYEAKISFIKILKENRKLYKILIENNISELEKEDYLTLYDGRCIYIKRVGCQLIEGHRAYAYIALDLYRKANESKVLFRRAASEGMTTREIHQKLSRQGIFILVSSRNLKITEILPIYYTRQLMEQVFGIIKNYGTILPIRIQNEKTFRGHLLLNFISTIVIKKLESKLLNLSYNHISLFINMKNQKCKVYNDKIIIQEALKKANDCYKLFSIKCPDIIMKKESMRG
jgi:hypothetical protein